ncbi:MAG: energy-coupling factor transporter transmembrane protein EcfT [Opitutales bacterium]|nr:energy-coupling factor transporter transmembrane protein EcfT [Opitutales bacterium]
MLQKRIGSENTKKPFVATLDMRTKLIISLAASSTSIFLNDWRLLLALNALTFVYVLSLRRFKPVAAMYAATALMLGIAFCFIPAFVWIVRGIADSVPAQAGDGFRRLAEILDEQGFATVLLPFLRISVSMNVFLALGLTFDNQEFISVMRKMRLARIVFIPLMICCRFVPSFVDDIRQLYESLRVRRRKMNFLSLVTSPLRFLRYVVVPVCVRTLRIADNLVLMCEVRRIGCTERCICATEHKMRSRDWNVLAFTFCATAAIWTLKFILPAPAETFIH